MVKATISVVVFLLLLIGEGQSRSMWYSSSDLVSDGIDHINPSPFQLVESQDSSKTCERVFSFLPCGDSIGSYLFLVGLYGYMLFIGESHIIAGSEIIFKTLGTGVFGASVFHILCGLPEAMIVLVSGLSKSKDEAQENVMTGVGLLAGSAITHLTLIWGTCIVVAKTVLPWHLTSNDPESSTPSNWRNGKQRSFLTRSGITTDGETTKTARIMVLSMIPFIIVQLPRIFKSYSWERTVALIALITSISFLLSYFVYQVIYPSIQKRRLEYVKLEYLIPDILQYVQRHALGNLLTEEGAPNVLAIERLFNTIDKNNDKKISYSEFREVLKEFEQFKNLQMTDGEIAELVKNFDADDNGEIDRHEFIEVTKKYAKEPKQCNVNQHSSSQDLTNEVYQEDWRKTDELVEENPKWTCFQAVLRLLFGMVIVALLSEPLVGAVHNFSRAVNIPPFYVSFIVVPLATNAREAFSAIGSARRKNQRTCSLTYSEIYGNVFMNNLLGLSVLLFLVYARGLTWNFSAEVAAVLTVCTVMGLLASFCRTFPLWTCFVAYILYPFSLLMVYVLDFILGWSN